MAEWKLSNLIDQGNDLECTLSRLALLPHIIGPKSRLDKYSLTVAGRFLNASETSSGMDISSNAVVSSIHASAHVKSLR